MWYWVIKVSILSLIFIFLLHYLYSFFISTLTVPKVKDLVTLPQEKYNEMFQSLHDPTSNNLNKNDRSYMNNNAQSVNSQSMKEDLIHFLKEIGSSNESVAPPALSSFYNSNVNSFDFDSNVSSFSFSK